MLERFVKEKQLRLKKHSAFDLEEIEYSEPLTHLGKALFSDRSPSVDDLMTNEETISILDEESPSEGHISLKHNRINDEYQGEIADDDDEHFMRKKSKREVMQDMIAKSKLYKYERQAAKDEDEQLRDDLDKQIAEVRDLLRTVPSGLSSESQSTFFQGLAKTTTLKEVNKLKLEKEYDMQLRKMVYDKKSQPTERTKTKEEIATERATKLQELESERLRRMQGDPIDKENEVECANSDLDADEENQSFGLGSGIKVRPSNYELGVEEEDDFIIDTTLVASGSDISSSDSDEDKDDVGLVDEDCNNYDPNIITEENSNKFTTTLETNDDLLEDLSHDRKNDSLPYEFPCPQSHKELLETIGNINIFDLPTVIQRIRVLHNPKLRSENKIKLEKFSTALVDHIYYLANREDKPPFKVLENLIRHIHSLAKSFPIEVSNCFRQHLKEFNLSRVLSPSPGDLILLTAISSIFPTSDHFHQVVTSALLIMCRYLGLKIPEYLYELAIGSYICTICLHYQKISRRYIPESINFIHNTLCTLAPIKLARLPGNFPIHKPKISLRLKGHVKSARKLSLFELFTPTVIEGEQKEALKVSLIDANLKILDAAADTWIGKAAFVETFQPSLEILEHLASSQCSSYFPESTKVIINLSSQIKFLLIFLGYYSGSYTKIDKVTEPVQSFATTPGITSPSSTCNQDFYTEI